MGNFFSTIKNIFGFGGPSLQSWEYVLFILLPVLINRLSRSLLGTLYYSGGKFIQPLIILALIYVFCTLFLKYKCSSISLTNSNTWKPDAVFYTVIAWYIIVFILNIVYPAIGGILSGILGELILGFLIARSFVAEVDNKCDE